MRISDWSSDVCSSDLRTGPPPQGVTGKAGMDQRPAVRLPSPGDHACRYAVDCGRAQRPANLAAYLIGLVVVQSRPTNARDPCETAGDRQIAGGDDQRHHKG